MRTFVYLSLLGLFVLRSIAMAADGDCEASPIVGLLLRYDERGRLTRVDDQFHRAEAVLTYRGDALDDIRQNEFKSKLDNPDRWGRTEHWDAFRWSEYDLKTGKLIRVHTFERVVIRPGRLPGGYKTEYEIPVDTDFSKLVGADGVIRYVGEAFAVSLFGDVRKPLGLQTLEITEPTNSHTANCFRFKGQGVALWVNPFSAAKPF